MIEEAQTAAIWFAFPFLSLTVIWLATCAAFAAFDPEELKKDKEQ